MALLRRSATVAHLHPLQTFTCLFFFLTLLSIPVMILYYSGNALNGEIVSVVETLSLLTMGNIGEGATICTQGVENEYISIQCPEGARIGSVEAYYGNPQGQCDCPSVQTPDPSCPGEEVGGRCKESSSPDSQYCFLDQ